MLGFFYNTAIFLRGLWSMRERLLCVVIFFCLFAGVLNYSYVVLSKKNQFAYSSYQGQKLTGKQRFNENYSLLSLSLINIKNQNLIVQADMLLPATWNINGKPKSFTKLDQGSVELSINDKPFQLSRRVYLKTKQNDFNVTDQIIKIPTYTNNYFFPFNNYQAIISPSYTVSGETRDFLSGKSSYSFFTNENYNLTTEVNLQLPNIYSGFAVSGDDVQAFKRGKRLTLPENAIYVYIYHPLWYKLLIILLICFSIVPIFLLMKKKSAFNAVDFFAYIGTLATFRIWIFGVTTEIHFIDFVFLMLIVWLSGIILLRD